MKGFSKEGVVERVLVWFLRLTEVAWLKSKILCADYMQLKPYPSSASRLPSHSRPAVSKKELSSFRRYLLFYSCYRSGFWNRLRSEYFLVWGLASGGGTEDSEYRLEYIQIIIYF